MNNYYKMFASCIPVRGISRSTICDLPRNKIRFIPNDFYDLLVKFEDCHIDEILTHYGTEHKEIITEYFDFLIENEFGFWCDDPDLFPKLNTYWKSASVIENGIIDVNNESRHDFEKIFRQYESLGCNALEIRFYEHISISELFNILNYLAESRIGSVDILLRYQEEVSIDDFKEIMNENPRIHSISIHSTPHEKLKGFNTESNIYFFETPVTSSTHCGKIGMKYFTVNQDTFFESQNFNTCLNKKISIDVNGDIKNCPSMQGVHGNIKDDLLSDILQNTNLNQVWSIHKEQIETCKGCEFRHVCTDCRAFLDSDKSKSKPKKCTYHPVTMEWK